MTERASKNSSRIARGFTLLELLVAISVLALLLTVLASFFGSVSSAWQFSREKMENFDKGRALINTISRDLSDAVIRQDLPAFPDAAAGEMAFFTKKFGQNAVSSSGRPLTFVSYSLAVRNDRRTVIRRDIAFDYVGSDVGWKPVEAGSAAPSSSALERVLCRDVYAFTFEFLNTDGTASKIFKNAAAAQPTVAVRVSLVILNPKAAEVLKAAGQEDGLAAELAATIPSGRQGYKTAWDSALLGGAFAGKYPAPVVAGIRTYERLTHLPVSPLVLPAPSP